jgi:hypothetical protein
MSRFPTEAEWRATMAPPPSIRCAACDACRWHPLDWSRCIYDGPFAAHPQPHQSEIRA